MEVITISGDTTFTVLKQDPLGHKCINATLQQFSKPA